LLIVTAITVTVSQFFIFVVISILIELLVKKIH